MKNLLKKTKDETGQSLILYAVLFAILLGFAALVIDLGMAKVATSNMQNAADAAAMAAVNNLPDTTAATNTALVYGQLNGADASNIVVNTPYNGEAGQIEVICSQTVDFTFANILGFKSTEVSARAVAEKGGSAGGAFEYALFSGSPTQLSRLGGQALIYGDMHSNNDFQLHGEGSEYNGDVEAVCNLDIQGNKVTLNGNLQGAYVNLAANKYTLTGTAINAAASYTEMPDLTSLMDAAIANAAYKFAGYVGYGGNDDVYNGSVYVDGMFNSYGGKETFTGAIMATGDVQFSGAKLYLSGTDGIAIYSANGNVRLNSASAEIHGIIYAPHGNVQLGAKCKVYGMIIADSITINASGIEIYYDDSYLAPAGIGNGGSSQLVE